MGYYANGSGSIMFKEVLPEETYKEVEEELRKALEADGERKFRMTSTSKEQSYIDIWDNEKYYGEEVEMALNNVAKMGDIEKGCIEYVGEDDCLWRFIYRDGEWVEENGHVEYNDYESDKLANAIKLYALYDLQAAERDYVYNTLTDVCGLDDKDIEKLGLDILLPPKC